MKALRAVLALVFLAPSVLLSQVATTTLRGVIKDPSGAVVPGAKITLTNGATGQKLEATSSGAGDYQFNQIPPAKYTITVTARGFGDQSKVAELLVNQPASIDFVVTVQATSEVINVSAEAQTLNTTDASLGDSFNTATIQALPSEGRNVPELLALQPGVLYLGHENNQTMDSRSGSVNGGRSDQGNVSIDGLDDNDQLNGFAFTGVLRETLDSVEEFRVVTTNSDAGSGRSSGAQVSLVTKGGTNQFHGGVYEYHRPTFTVANDWFNKQAQAQAGEPNIPGKLIRNTFGAAVGGPILKDKLFFFANYEGQRTAENTQVSRTAPTASFQQGFITYQTTKDGNNPNGYSKLSPADIASMDPACSGNGTCPWGAGVDPNALALFNTYPAANGDALGDGGFNFGSFTFSSPSPATLNTSIVKLDYRPNDRQAFFVRGNLQKDVTTGVEQFPGLGPNDVRIDNTKGMAAGFTWTLTPNFVNDLRYGFVRQGYSDRGTLQGDNVTFRFIDQPIGQSRSNIVHIPVHNIVDNISWTKGKHAIAVGVNWRLIHNQSDTDNNSYNSASTNEYWLANGGAIAYQGGDLDPGAFGFPAVCCGGSDASTDFSNSYNIAIAMITGLVPETNGQYNYTVSKNGSSATQNADGAFVNHEYKANEFEYFVQDSWRVTPKLTVTAGLRHSLLQTPYEINGQQVAPTVDTDAWFTERATDAQKGIPFEPLLTFAPNGQSRGGKPYWPMNKANIAPRFAIAYAATPRTAIRAGFGMYYDHFGQSIVSSFDQFGSFGLATSVSNPAGVFSVDTAPRFTGLNNIPPLPSNLVQPSTLAYPYAPPNAFAITWGIDSKIHTPYSYAIDLSVQQDLGKGFVFETAYVGRLGRHLMQQRDLAEPVNYVDPQSGRSYFAAGTALSKAVDAGASTVAKDQYWEDLFPNLATGGETATQNIYDNYWIRGNETTSLAFLDTPSDISGLGAPSPCDPKNGGPGCYRFWQPQFSSLYSWASIGTSSYNALQFILRHAFAHGLQVDASYTFSKSLDLGSDAERFTEIAATGFSTIINSFNPKMNKGVSDFNVANNITTNWTYQLPVGRGQAFGGGMGRLADAVVGGWQLSGLYRWTTGLPFSLFAEGWATNWQEESGMIQTAPIVTHKHIQSNGAPQVFANPNSLPLRLAYPGEAGQRNNYVGDGYFDIDSGLRKSWKVTEAQAVNFTWEVFNVTNSVRFDTNPVYLSSQFGSGSLGDYSGTLSQPRKMQFSLRYDF